MNYIYIFKLDVEGFESPNSEEIEALLRSIIGKKKKLYMTSHFRVAGEKESLHFGTWKKKYSSWNVEIGC